MLTLAQKQDTKEELNAFGAWKDNPVYKKLAVVKAGHVIEIGGDNWTWGGPLTAARLAEKIADALTAAALTGLAVASRARAGARGVRPRARGSWRSARCACWGR